MLIPETLLENIARGKTAMQSSYAASSSPDDACGAVDGNKTGGYGFHTALEWNPWWMVDLAEVHAVHRIIVFNRDDALRERISSWTVDAADDSAGPWRQIASGVGDFGGVRTGRPLVLEVGGLIEARFVRFMLRDLTILHLDEVEIYGVARAGAYRSLISEELRRPDKAAIAPGASGAIVCLTRGYDTVAEYDALIRRNRAIYEMINQGRTEQYPLIIWHEGNITPAHQDHVLAQEMNSDVRFRNVAHLMAMPQACDPAEFLEHWTVGYRAMCRFHAGQIWELVSGYEYIMRIDEDCFLTAGTKDPIAWARKAGMDFGAPLFVDETHDLTRQGLSSFVSEYARATGLGGGDSFYLNGDYPYTNVYVGRVAFFLRPDVQKFLRAVTREPDQLRMRWGDLPILGAALNMFARTDRVALIPQIAYLHDSHQRDVATSAQAGWGGIRGARRTTLASEAAALLYGEGRAHQDDGRWEAAETAYLKALAIEPGSKRLQLALGSVATSLGRHRTAVERFATGLQGAPTRVILPEHYFYRATSLHALGRFPEAIACFADMFACDMTFQARHAAAWIATFDARERRGFWVAPDGIFAEHARVDNVFSTVYAQNIWGSGSGGGSDVAHTTMYAGLVQHIVRGENIRRIVDIGCGDWQFSRYIEFGKCEYVGFDIVDSVVSANNALFGSATIRFVRADATTLEVPPCDLVLCKDVLQHLSNENVSRLLTQLPRQATWLITNDYWPLNEDCRNGDTRPLSPVAAPFDIIAYPVLTFASKVAFLHDAVAAAAPDEKWVECHGVVAEFMPAPGLRNVARTMPARQSSVSVWSTPGDAESAVSGTMPVDFAFHTDVEEAPWWEVDLQATWPITAIVIHNRIGGFQDRAIGLRVEIATSYGAWRAVWTILEPFGGTGAGQPQQLLFAQPADARFIRLSLPGKSCLHLAQVEVFARSEVDGL